MNVFVMDWSGFAVLTGFGITMLVAAFTLVILQRVPASLFKSLSSTLLLLTICASLVYSAAFADLPHDTLAVLVTVAPLMVVWTTPVLLDMMTSLVGNPRIKNDWLRRGFIYAPIGLITALIAGAWAANPSYFEVEWTYGIPKAVRNPLILTLIGIAAAFFLASFIQGVRVLRTTLGEMRTDIGLLTGFLGVELVAMPVILVLAPLVSLSAVTLILSTLMSVMISRAVLVKSLLLTPQKEDVPKKTGVGTGTDDTEADACVELAPGNIIFYTGPEQARDVFVSLVKKGREGLWVTRRSPHDIREKFGLAKTPIVWLTAATAPDIVTIKPDELGRLTSVITSFIRDAHDFVILFEGLEYLSANNGFKSLLNMVHLLNDRIMSSAGSLMLVGNPDAFQASDFSVLKSEAAQVCHGPPAPSSKEAHGKGH